MYDRTICVRRYTPESQGNPCGALNNFSPANTSRYLKLFGEIYFTFKNHDNYYRNDSHNEWCMSGGECENHQLDAGSRPY